MKINLFLKLLLSPLFEISAYFSRFLLQKIKINLKKIFFSSLLPAKLKNNNFYICGCFCIKFLLLFSRNLQAIVEKAEM